MNVCLIDVDKLSSEEQEKTSTSGKYLIAMRVGMFFDKGYEEIISRRTRLSKRFVLDQWNNSILQPFVISIQSKVFNSMDDPMHYMVYSNVFFSFSCIHWTGEKYSRSEFQNQRFIRHSISIANIRPWWIDLMDWRSSWRIQFYDRNSKSTGGSISLFLTRSFSFVSSWSLEP